MPLRDIKATVTVAGEGDKRTETLNIEPGPAYPDVKAAYVATLPRNYAGATTSTLVTNGKGLLSSESSTKFMSSGQDIARAIGDLAGRVQGNALLENAQCTVGTYSTLINPFRPGATQLCSYLISVEDAKKIEDVKNSVAPGATPAARKSGVYYRVPVPYVVTAKRGSDTTRHIVLSPSGSNDYFLPVTEGLFANNESKLTFEEGVPTKYNVDLGNEVVGLLALPATVIDAYVSAITRSFTNEQAAEQRDIDRANKRNAEALAQARSRLCLEEAAKQPTDLEKLKALCETK